MTEGMLKMMGVFSELERNIISQRVKSGLQNAKAKGVSNTIRSTSAANSTSLNLQGSVQCPTQRFSSTSLSQKDSNIRQWTNCPLFKITKGGSTASRLKCFLICYIDVFIFRLLHEHIFISVIKPFTLHAVYFTTEIDTLRARLLIIHYSKLLH